MPTIQLSVDPLPNSRRLSFALLALTISALAAHPVAWLVTTWTDPAYDSYGLWVAILVFGLAVWSANSPIRADRNQSSSVGIPLLLAGSAVRLVGQLLGVNIVSAMTLVVDVYALGHLLGLSQRRRHLAPFWLAVLFAFSLPFERVLQHTVGFGLQQISATGACALLQLGSEAVQCEGVRIALAGKDVLVDLPCSGARGLLLVLALFAALAALSLPSRRYAAAGFVLALAGAWLGNVLRIVTLAIGIAHPEWLGNIPVMEAPWHELIGLITLLISSLPLLIWARTTRQPTSGDPKYCSAKVGRFFRKSCARIEGLLWTETPYPTPPAFAGAGSNPPPHRGREFLGSLLFGDAVREFVRARFSPYTATRFARSLLPPGRGEPVLSAVEGVGMGVERSQSAQAIRRFPTVFDRKRRQVLQPCYAFLVLASAVVVTVLPAQPVDVAQAMPAPKLPRFIDGLAADARPLTPREQIYFTRYGGGAARASYDDYGLLMVRTSAPLRHLHGPDECLRGAGHQVRYLGSIYAPLPTAVYRSVDPQGQTWRIAVSFISSRGEITTSVAHAVWLWMQHPGTAWTQVQRVTPWDADPARQWAWDRAVARALDLPVTRDRRDVNFAVFTKPLESKSAQIININKNIEL